MSKLATTERDGKIIGYLMRSPGSGAIVCFYTKDSGECCHWDFNGDMERPTFSPSMLLYPNNLHGRDHFFVRDGKIQYLSDCDHALAGQTVDMVDFSWGDDDE